MYELIKFMKLYTFSQKQKQQQIFVNEIPQIIQAKQISKYIKPLSLRGGAYFFCQARITKENKRRQLQNRSRDEAIFVLRRRNHEHTKVCLCKEVGNRLKRVKSVGLKYMTNHSVDRIEGTRRQVCVSVLLIPMNYAESNQFR